MKPSHSKLCYRSTIVGLLALLACLSYEWSTLVPKANAIPAFARKYNFACNVCHVPGFPKLNDFGNLFRDQGYQLGTDNDLPTFEGITMGFWPVSFRTTVGYQVANVRTDGQSLSSSGFGFTGLDVLSFGTLHRNIAFGLVFTPGLNSAGFGTGTSESDSNLESAFVRLMNLERFLGGSKDTYWMNLRVGKYELDVPFSEKRSPTLNTPFVMYHYVSGSPYQGGPLGGLPTLAYNNASVFGLGDNQPGAELSGIIKTNPTGGYVRYSLNMLTTNGGSFSNDSGGFGRSAYFYGHVTHSFGGYGIVTGQRIGAFVVAGNAPTQCPSSIGGGAVLTANGGAGCTQPGTATQGEPFTRVGGDLSLTFDGQWNLFGAFMHAVDSSNLISSQNGGVNAGGGTNFQNASWNGGFVELDWYPSVLPFFNSPGWLLSYRYDIIRNVRQGDPTFTKSYNDVDSQTAMIRYYIHQSTRTDLALHLEYNWYKDKGVGANGGNWYGQTTLVGLDFAF